MDKSSAYEPSFSFRQRFGKLNLRELEAIDLEKIINEVDIDSLQQYLDNLTFSGLDMHYLTDQQVLKAFKLSQLSIEYLLFTQEQLVTKLKDLSKKYSKKKK
jgi:hypothetical protein